MSDEDWGTWESSRQRSYTRGLDVSAEERLAWLEEMIAFAWSTGALPKPRDEWGQSLDVGHSTR